MSGTRSRMFHFRRSRAFQSLVDRVEDGTMPIRIGKVFRLDDIVAAHRLMESNQAGGKIVVTLATFRVRLLACGLPIRIPMVSSGVMMCSLVSIIPDLGDPDP